MRWSVWNLFLDKACSLLTLQILLTHKWRLQVLDYKPSLTRRNSTVMAYGTPFCCSCHAFKWSSRIRVDRGAFQIIAYHFDSDQGDSARSHRRRAHPMATIARL